jgi:hypothetical protein
MSRPRRRWNVIFEWTFKKWDGGLDWIDLTQDMDKWLRNFYIFKKDSVPWN